MKTTVKRPRNKNIYIYKKKKIKLKYFTKDITSDNFGIRCHM